MAGAASLHAALAGGADPAGQREIRKSTHHRKPYSKTIPKRRFRKFQFLFYSPVPTENLGIMPTVPHHELLKDYSVFWA